MTVSELTCKTPLCPTVTRLEALCSHEANHQLLGSSQSFHINGLLFLSFEKLLHCRQRADLASLAVTASGVVGGAQVCLIVFL